MKKHEIVNGGNGTKNHNKKVVADRSNRK